MSLAYLKARSLTSNAKGGLGKGHLCEECGIVRDFNSQSTSPCSLLSPKLKFACILLLVVPEFTVANPLINDFIDGKIIITVPLLRHHFVREAHLNLLNFILTTSQLIFQYQLGSN